jgi:hypothetical protein
MLTTYPDECIKTQDAAPVKDFQNVAQQVVASENIGPDPAFPDFDLICDA